MNTNSINSAMRVLRASTIVILGLITATVPALGADSGEIDSKMYPGSICRDASYTGGYTNGTKYTSQAYVANKRTDRAITVVCPIIRDNMTNSAGIGGISIYYTDNHPNEEITCRARSRRLNGNAYDYSRLMESHRTGSDVMRVGNAVTTRYADSYLTIDCTIPPRSASGEMSLIKSLIILENP